MLSFRDVRTLVRVVRSLHWLASTPIMEGVAELLDTLTVRAAEVVPDDVRVYIQRGALKVEGTDPLAPAGVTMLGLTTRQGMFEHGAMAQMPPLVGVTMGFGKSLQKMVAKTRRVPWPSAAAMPHCAVTSTQLRLWWGGPNESEAEVALRPIPRTDIGMEWPAETSDIVGDGEQ